MSNSHLSTDLESEPCEKCGTPVVGYVAEYCCNGRECACMGWPVEPCWCEKCWAQWEADSKKHADEFIQL